MKKCVAFLFGILLLAGCKSKNTANKKFIVSGTITNGPDRMLYLEEIPMSTMERKVVDSVKPGKDGKFELKAKPGESSLYDLRYALQLDPVAYLINDSSPINVEASTGQNNGYDYTVDGSMASIQMKIFIAYFNKELNRYLDLEKQIVANGSNDSIEAHLENERTRIADSLKSFTIKAIRDSKNPALAMFELGYFQTTANNPDMKLQGLRNKEVSRIVNNIAAEFPSHTGIAMIKNSLDAQLQKPGNWVGQMAPEIVMNDVNGKQVSLSGFRGKYVLVDFWASWCPPCRAENPNIARIWEKYRTKNFEILGVSLDKPGEKEEWLKAIREDGLTWTHVSDLLSWNSPVVPLYGFNLIPYNVLIDPNGMVIAESLYGPELEEILAEVLK
ncbi:MAG TPA: TlpA disulfide reductase family protein [Chitinophagaceae bacterium]|nr:TlpA disulfide reductase family protein [Chitinophagaceae bacterium]